MANGKHRVLNVWNDPPDHRDRIYEPALVQIKSKIDNRDPKLVLDQGQEGACTGFGLAAVINLLNKKRGKRNLRVSPHMLYEMAKKHDEWPGEAYVGSSCRGAIRGWKNMGVCSDELWPYQANAPNILNIQRAIQARENTVGAYYRLRPEISDYHAAINETGAVYVSARVHSGWSSPRPETVGQLPVIKPSDQRTGGHAFAIIGYNTKGFIVQNSWGKKWGDKGFALWLYEDWIKNIKDGWAFRLALPTPQIFGMVPSTMQLSDIQARRPAPKRLEIAGHFVHFDDGSYKEHGDYWSTAEDVELTADLIAKSNDYKHLMVYAHGGLNSPKDSACRISALKEGFKRNGIYPFHIMYDTGLVEELKDVVKRALGLAEQRSEGFVDWIIDQVTELTDTLIEDAIRAVGASIWEEMKRDARVPFEPKSVKKIGDGMHFIKTFAEKLGGIDRPIHLVGHSTGGILLGHLLDALDKLGKANLVKSCSLMAPACSVPFYKDHYEPRLGSKVAGTGKVVCLPKLEVYNLTDDIERDDNVAYAYRKSLLYLVSRALERTVGGKPLLGMQIYSKQLPIKRGLKFIYAGSSSKLTRSKTHGGFDNDHHTAEQHYENDSWQKGLATVYR